MTAGIVIVAILMVVVAVYLVVAVNHAAEKEIELRKREQNLKYRELKQNEKK